MTTPAAILIAGSNGMLGTAFQMVCAERGIEVVAPAESGFDITSPVAVAAAVHDFAAAHRDGVLVNAAAYTNVERAEGDRERAFLVNQYGAALLAEAAKREGIRFAHVSTDFVFDGEKDGAYAETDEPHPLSVYGSSKLAGEIAVHAADRSALIVRTAWVFGPAGVNFPTKILERAAASPKIQVVFDEIGSPTYTLDLAAGILGLIDAGARGVYHLAGSGWCSRFELAREILRLAGLDDVEVQPVTSATFATKAPRPANSVLDCGKAAALGVTMPDWHEGIARFVGSLA